MDSKQMISEQKPVRRRSLSKVVIIGLVLLLAAGGAFWFSRAEREKPPALKTAEVTRGELVETISATGTVEPEEVVDVGAQIAGQILAFGLDAGGRTVDYGSAVKKGTVLARIDDSLYAADEAKARAQVQASRAAVGRAEADLGQMKAKLKQAERDWARAQKLGPSEALSQASFDAYQSAHDTAKANLAVGEAAVLQAKADLAQSEAALVRAQKSLGYCTITSPVAGVIIDRRVNIGQTVVASLNAPSLFLIAKDLKRMQVWVAVNEADIGRIRPGQPVSFTVDAFPGETFGGEVGKVRLNASMTQNVVTYTVEIITDNSSGRLLPYLSANVRFEVRRFKDALLVPSPALRWKPPASLVMREPEKPAPAKPAEGPAPGGDGVTSKGTVWVRDGEKVRPIRLGVLAADAGNTAVRSRELTEGMQVVVGLDEPQGQRAEGGNPFAPKFPGRSSSRQQQ